MLFYRNSVLFGSRFLKPFQCICVRSFYEPFKKGDKKYVKEDNQTSLEKFKSTLILLREECKLWTEEMKEDMKLDQKFYVPGDTQKIWTFNHQDTIDKWIVTSDQDNKEGSSHCKFELSKNQKGLFHGFLDTTVPKDGLTYRTGYCNISSTKARKAFSSVGYWDWTMFTHLVMNVRGDGRSYMIVMKTSGIFDVTWHNMHSFILYTRGGPYWQYVKIPFSKFFLTSKSRVQDKQCPIPLNRVENVGITCADNMTGAFQLEIDYIGIHMDSSYKEEFAYEMYQTGKYVVT